MAFSLDYLAKIELSQNQFERTYNAATGSASGIAIEMWTFNASASAANNSTAQTVAANYFNGANGYLKVGDLIWVVSNDPGYHLIYVATNAGGNVTTVNLI